MYRGRIGTPTTDDEVYGYGLFVTGIALGVLRLALFYGSPSRSMLREFGYVFAAVESIERVKRHRPGADQSE